MKKAPVRSRAAKFVGAGILAASLLAVTTGCAAGATSDAAPAATASTTTAAATPSPEAKKPLSTQLVSIIDANTVEVLPVSSKNGQPTGEPSLKVRMLGVAVPQGDTCGAAEALANLKSVLAPKAPITVTYEPTLANDTDKDGAQLAYVVTGGRSVQDIGLRMVTEGFASAVYPQGASAPAKFSQYTSGAKSAVDQKLGMWAKCPAPAA